MRACSAGGRVVLVGMGDEVMKLDMTHACTHEIDLVGSFRYANTVRPPLPCCHFFWSCVVLRHCSVACRCFPKLACVLPC